MLAAARELALLSGGKVWVVHVRERSVSRYGGAEAETAGDAASGPARPGRPLTCVLTALPSGAG